MFLDDSIQKIEKRLMRKESQRYHWTIWL